jgi:NitT/TauT family transport system permease protein
MSADVLTPIVDDAPPQPEGRSVGSRLWRWGWPKLLAIVLAVLLWQLAYWILVDWTQTKPVYLFPPPSDALSTFFSMLGTDQFWTAVGVTLRRAVIGYLIALVVGTAIGLAVARIRPLRAGVGSLITGLQTMPSIAWFPFAIVLVGLSEKAIMFVVLIGAAPSIANGVISGVDHIPPQFLKLGQVLGARGPSLYRHIVVPAMLPHYVSGLNQGWAFAWRSLMAGELLGVVAASGLGMGGLLNGARMMNDMAKLEAVMLSILIVGMLVDGVFTSISSRMRRRRGLALD